MGQGYQAPDRSSPSREPEAALRHRLPEVLAGPYKTQNTERLGETQSLSVDAMGYGSNERCRPRTASELERAHLLTSACHENLRSDYVLRMREHDMRIAIEKLGHLRRGIMKAAERQLPAHVGRKCFGTLG